MPCNDVYTFWTKVLGRDWTAIQTMEGLIFCLHHIVWQCIIKLPYYNHIMQTQHPYTHKKSSRESRSCADVCLLGCALIWTLMVFLWYASPLHNPNMSKVRQTHGSWLQGEYPALHYLKDRLIKPIIVRWTKSLRTTNMTYLFIEHNRWQKKIVMKFPAESLCQLDKHYNYQTVVMGVWWVLRRQGGSTLPHSIIWQNIYQNVIKFHIGVET